MRLITHFVVALFMLTPLACGGGESARREPPPPVEPAADPMVAACEAGTAQSCLVAADAAERDGERSDARKLYAAACDLQDARGCALGGGLAAEIGDLERANGLFERGCEMGDGTSCYGIGMVALGYFGGEPSPEDARAAFERGCEAGLPDACAATADLVEAGQGARADPARAADLRERACEGGHAESCTHLGLLAVKAGEEAKAEQRFEQACAHDVPDPAGCAWYGWSIWSEGSEEEQTRGESFLDSACAEGSGVGCMFRAVVAARAGETERAAKLLDRACEVEPEECEAHRAQFRSASGSQVD